MKKEILSAEMHNTVKKILEKEKDAFRVLHEVLRFDF